MDMDRCGQKDSGRPDEDGPWYVPTYVLGNEVEFEETPIFGATRTVVATVESLDGETMVVRGRDGKARKLRDRHDAYRVGFRRHLRAHGPGEY